MSYPLFFIYFFSLFFILTQFNPDRAYSIESVKENIVVLPLSAPLLDDSFLNDLESIFTEELNHSAMYTFISGRSIRDLLVEQFELQKKKKQLFNEKECIAAVLEKMKSNLLLFTRIVKNNDTFHIDSKIENFKTGVSVIQLNTVCKNCDLPTLKKRLRLITVRLSGADSFFNNTTYYDSGSKLLWQREHDGIQKKWDEALAYCTSLNLEMYSDWRVPTKEELLTIIVQGETPSINATIFPKTPSSFFWSSSNYSYNSLKAWSLLFSTGSSVSLNKKDSYYVRCVRND